MPFSAKIFFSIGCVVVGALICFAKYSGNAAGKDWFWRGGKNDPFRNIIFHADGSMRKYAKVWVIALFAVLLFVLWLFVPLV